MSRVVAANIAVVAGGGKQNPTALSFDTQSRETEK